MRNRQALFAVGACLALAGPVWPQVLSADLRMLVGIKERVHKQTASITNFTCLETLQRYRKPAGAKSKLTFVDNVRLDVLYSGTQELYSSPGARRFANDDLKAYAGGALIAGGAFAGYLSQVFGGQAIIKYQGMETLRGVEAARYSFLLSSFLNPLTIDLGGAKAVTGLKGSFWADPVSFALLRMELEPDELPPLLEAKEIGVSMDYSAVRVGEQDLVVPYAAEMFLIRNSGEESRTSVEFSQCRKFEAESKLTFGADPPAALPTQPTPAPAPGAPVLPETLPPGLEVDLRLTAPVDSSASVGALLNAKVAKDVLFEGKVLIPKDTIATGRIRHLEKRSDTGDYWIVSLEFVELESGAATTRLFADLVRIDAFPGLEPILSSSSTLSIGERFTSTTVVNRRVLSVPGVASFFVSGERFQLPKGFGMVWKTLK